MFTSARRVLAALNARLEVKLRQSRRKYRAAMRTRQRMGALECLEDRCLLSVITVTSLADFVEDGDEQLTLREAILIANDSTGATSFEGVSSTDVADTIVFDDAVFSASDGDVNTDTIFLFSQLPVVTETLTIDGSIDGGTARVIIDGGRESRILENASSGLNLEDLVLQNGFAFGNGGAVLNTSQAVLILNNVEISDSRAFPISSFTASNGVGGRGGGLFNATGGTVTITDSLIARNSAVVSGGGIHNEGNLTINDSAGQVQITENEANAGLGGNGGGGIFNSGTLLLDGALIADNVTQGNGGGILNSGSLTVTDSTLEDNTAVATGGEGGGLFNSGTASINASTFRNNAAAFGGGASNTGTLQIGDTLFSVNFAQIDGGGLENIGELTVTGGTFDENRALVDGGAFSNFGTASFDGTQFTNNSAEADGGAISNFSRLTIENSAIAGNSAGGLGGGIVTGDIEGESATLTVLNSTIAGNTADSGGGIFNFGVLALSSVQLSGNTAQAEGGGVFNQGTAGLLRATLTGNAGSSGGGIYNAGGVPLEIRESEFSGNTATGDGGGLFNNGETTIDSTSFIDNSAGADGGAIRNVQNLTITKSTISGNSGVFGGGIFNAGDGLDTEVTIRESTVSGNLAEQDGGGIFSIGQLLIENSTISGNIAGGNGGGLMNSRTQVSSGSVNVLNSTVSGNAAVQGGGIFTRGSTFLLSVTVASNSASQSGGGVFSVPGVFSPVSTIIADNTANSAPDVNGPMSDVGGFNLIENTSGIIGQLDDRTIVGVDPLLGPLQDNGGPTLTHALLPGSPAINAGANPARASFDQRGLGFDRTVGTQTDIGAYEVQALAAPGRIVVGSGLGADPVIRIFDPDTNQPIASFEAFHSFFRGGVRVATGDVNGDGVADIVASSSSKGQPRVRVFDGRDLTGGTVLMDFFAYVPEFGGGVFVATGDFNNDGRADIVTGAGAGGGPHVKVFSGADLSGNTLLMSFFAYDPNFGGGVEVAAGDVNGDGTDDVITGAGPGGGPHVRVFSGADLSARTELMSFYAYAPEFGGGVHVAAGDLNDDGRDDVITGAGFGGGPHVKAFSGADLSSGTLLANFFAYDPAFLGGVRVASGDVNGDGVDDLVTGAGPTGGPHVRAFDGLTGQEITGFYGAAPDFGGGVYVGVAGEPSEPTSPRSGGGFRSELRASGSSSSASVISFDSLDAVFSETDLALDLFPL